MKLKQLLVRILTVLGAGFVVIMIALRILLPREVFDIVIIEGLEPICWFGLFPLLAVGIPAYLIYRLYLRLKRNRSDC